MRTSQRLIELMFVVVVIGITAAIAIPNIFNGWVKRDMRVIQRACEVYLDQNGVYTSDPAKIEPLLPTDMDFTLVWESSNMNGTYERGATLLSPNPECTGGYLVRGVDWHRTPMAYELTNAVRPDTTRRRPRFYNDRF